MLWNTLALFLPKNQQLLCHIRGETKIYIIIGLTSQCKTIYSEKNLPASLSQVNQRHDDRKHQV